MYDVGNLQKSDNEVQLSAYGEQIIQGQERGFRLQTRLSLSKIIELERWLAKRSRKPGPLPDEKRRVIQEYKVRVVNHTGQVIVNESEIYNTLKKKYPKAIKWDGPQYHNTDGKGLQRLITSQVYGEIPFKRYIPPTKNDNEK